MHRRLILIFMAVVGLSVTGVVWFIQSKNFANFIKRNVAGHIPVDLGVEGDFSELAINLLPPGISILNPRITFKAKNLFNLPAGSAIKAERVDLIFLPLQIFSGNIRLQRISLVKGEIKMAFEKGFFQKKTRKAESGLKLGWNDLVRVRTDGIHIEDTKLDLMFADLGVSTLLNARSLDVSKVSDKSAASYAVAFELMNVAGQFPKSWVIPELIDKLSGSASINEAGIKINELAMVVNGSSLRTEGLVSGDIFSPRELNTQLKLNIMGDISSGLMSFMPSAKGAVIPSGRVNLLGQVSGDLMRPMQTLRVDGSLLGEDVKFKAWALDRVALDGQWMASALGGDVLIKKIAVTSREFSREGGKQAGWGGQIRADSFRFKIGATEEITIPLHLERAHIHWLAAPVIKDIYPLDFRASGAIELFVRPPKSGQGWIATAKVGLRLEKFQLDNQRFGRVRPAHNVLAIPEIKLDGEVSIDSNSLQPKGLLLAVAKSKFQVSGKVDFKTGFDIHASGFAHLDDIGKLAEVDIRGEGSLDIHVHGPSARTIIDFDTDLKNASYLHLSLGDLKGRLTYDEDPSLLFIREVALQRGETAYSIDGQLDLTDADKISLLVRLSRGSVQDFLGVFDDLTSDLWWFPRQIKGEMDADIRISGGISLNELEIMGRIDGTDWDYYGERFKAVTLRGGYDRGKYLIQSLKAIKRGGSLSGRISFDAEKRFAWEFGTEGLTVGELDHIARLDVPIRGRLKLNSSGRGKAGSIESTTTATLTEAIVRGARMPPSDLRVTSSQGVSTFKMNAFDGQGIFDLAYDTRLGGRSWIKGALRRLDFSPLLLLLNPKGIQDGALAGLISGDVDINFRSGEIDRASGRLALTEYLLAKSGSMLSLVEPVTVDIDRGTFDLANLSIKGKQGQATLSLRGRDTLLDGAIQGELDVAVVEFLSPAISQAGGVAKLDFVVGGTIRSPSLFGKATLDGAVLKTAALEAPFENIEGVLQLRQDTLTIQNLEADLANGRVLIGGTVQLFWNKFPKLSLNATLANNKLKIFPFQFVKVRGTVSVHGDALPYTVDGNVLIDSALSREKIMVQGSARALKSARYTPPPGQSREGELPVFRLNISATADQGIVVQNELFDAELKWQVIVINSPEVPRIMGSAEIVHGKMTFKDRIFQIQSANLLFDNPTVINPGFNLTATTEVNQVKVQLFASGKLTGYKVELSSNPVMPEAEILSLLALGLTAEDIKRFGSGDRATVDKSEGIAILLHSMDFNRDVETKTGFQIQLDETLNQQAGSSIFRPRAETDSAAAPKIVIKRKIGKKFELSLGSTVGVGTNTEQEVNLEYQVTPAFSAIGVWNSAEGVDAQNRTSYGVDLKVQKRFR